MSATSRQGGAGRAAAAALLIAAAAACATAPVREEPAVSDVALVRFRIDAEHVPAPPMELGGGVAVAWDALREGQAAMARQALQEAPAADLAADPAGAACVEGFLALADGAGSAARRAFQRALDAVPDYPPALYGMGVAAEAGDRLAAMEWYRRATRAAPTLSEATVRLEALELQEALSHLVRGERARAGGDTATAEAELRDAIELAPSLVRPWIRLAELYRESGETGLVVDVLRDARSRVGDQRAVLEPLGKALQEAGEYAEAYDVFQRLREIAPDDPAVQELVAEARRLYETTSLPEPYRGLPEKPILERQDLAALIAIRLPELADRVAEPRDGVIITDIGDSWAESFIREVVSWGVMEVFQNHAFVPELEVKRQLFVEVAYRVLELIDAVDGAPRARLRDVPASHFFHDEIQVVVGLGILELDAQGRFGILEPVSGDEAVAAVQRLVRLARERGI